MKPTNLILLIFAACLAACTGTGKLAEGERLYTRAKVKIQKPEKFWELGTLKLDLKRAVALPRPNKHLLWLRPGVSIYNTFHSEDGKGFGDGIANSLGKEPVLFNENIVEQHKKALVERANNDGFFALGVKAELRGTNKKVRAIYTVSLFQPVKKFGVVTYPSDSLALPTDSLPPTITDSAALFSEQELMLRKLQAYKAETLIKQGDLYQLETLLAERQRLSDSLRNAGWYYFSPDFFLFEADTMDVQEQANLRLTIKPEAGEKERRRYRIGKIFIYPDYDVAAKPVNPVREFYGQDSCIQFIYTALEFRKSLIVDNLRIRCGDLYSTKNYQNTLFRLLNLSFFKFVNIRYEPSGVADTLLDAHVYLTPSVPQKIEWRPALIISPGLYAGAEGELTYLHRNVFRGGENLRVTTEGSFLQFSGTDEDLPISTLFASKIQAQFIVPRNVLSNRRMKESLTATKFTVNHEGLWFNLDLGEDGDLRLTFNEVYGEAGFIWKKNRQASLVQEINPFGGAFNFVLANPPEFKTALLAQIPQDTTGEFINLATSIEYRPSYVITYDNRFVPDHELTRFMRQRLAFQTRQYFLPQALKDSISIPVPLNFYTESDVRHYFQLNKRTVLAGRLAFFFGIPLTPNSFIPLTNSYTIGGASSVRGFAPRSIGPGSSEPDTVANDGGIFLTSHTGNLLLEGSVELRHRLGRFWEVATFFDFGNIWLTQDRSDLEGETFRLNRFYRELATSGGVGLRLNLGFFVIRLDLAAPLTKPYLPQGERLVLNEINPFRGDWWLSGVRWNLAFGHPF